MTEDTANNLNQPDPRSAGIQALRSGNLAVALEQLAEAVRRDPRDPEAYGYLGVAHAQFGDFDAAIDSLRAAVTLAPRSAPLWHNLGKSLEQTGNLPEAIEAYRRACALNPDYQPALRALDRLAAIAEPEATPDPDLKSAMPERTLSLIVEAGELREPEHEAVQSVEAEPVIEVRAEPSEPVQAADTATPIILEAIPIAPPVDTPRRAPLRSVPPPNIEPPPAVSPAPPVTGQHFPAPRRKRPVNMATVFGLLAVGTMHPLAAVWGVSELMASLARSNSAPPASNSTDAVHLFPGVPLGNQPPGASNSAGGNDPLSGRLRGNSPEDLFPDAKFRTPDPNNTPMANSPMDGVPGVNQPAQTVPGNIPGGNYPTSAPAPKENGGHDVDPQAAGRPDSRGSAPAPDRNANAPGRNPSVLH